MSEKSKRRAAEMAVINAAVRVTEAPAPNNAGSTFWAAVGDLDRCVENLRALGLSEPTGTPTNHGSAQTAYDAARSMEAIVGKVAGDVFREILTAHHAGATGLTTDAIEVRLKGTHQGISPRVTELRQKGWIYETILRRETRSGRKAIVWAPTLLGIEAAGEVSDWSW
jgi:hypothetical protein